MFPLTGPQADTWTHSTIAATPSAIADWVSQLRKPYGAAPVLVGLEQKREPLLYALCQYDNLVLVPINPRTWRWSCPIFLRQTLVAWVDHAGMHSAGSQAFYRRRDYVRPS
jgi:hypothetical protein